MKENYISEIASILKDAKRLLFITGAGVSADSGLPTYRGIGGLYEGETTEEGVAIEDALSGYMLRTQPELTWKYLLQIGRACAGKQPNTAHKVMAHMEQNWDVCVLTQNIDGFHKQAGSQNLIEMHGNMRSLYCMECGASESVNININFSTPPICPGCGGQQRPNVVLFGEMLPEQALNHYYRELSLGFDLVFSVGTSSVFPYISGSVEEAIRTDIPTVEINPGQTELSGRVRYHVARRAAEWFRELSLAL